MNPHRRLVWLSFTSAAVNCALPPGKEGIFKSLSMVKPRSAITLSPGGQSSFSNMPDFLTISLSEIEPSYSSLTNDTEPEGDTPIKLELLKRISTENFFLGMFQIFQGCSFSRHPLKMYQVNFLEM